MKIRYFMYFKWVTILAIVTLISFNGVKAQSGDSGTRLLIRCDDFGMCHAVNCAARELIETDIPFSASVMFTCPWYQEIVDILKANPQISVGVHLTLNSEWKNYRWGPVLGASAVPSLVDSCGYFYPSRALFFANEPDIGEIEKELRAQIDRALRSGLKIDYLDYHMSTLMSTPELRSLVVRLAQDYELGFSEFLGEVNVDGVYAIPFEDKLDSLISQIQHLEDNQTYLLVFHIGLDRPEMRAMLDLNTFGLKEMSRHREAELKAACSEKFRETLKKENIELITYRQYIAQRGLDNMSYPGDPIY